MSRKIPNQKKKYKELEKRINTYTLELERIFETLNTEAARLALITSYDNTGEELFSFKDFPETKYGIERLQEQYVNDISSLIYSSTSQEWHNSNLATDLMVDGVLKSYTGFVNRELHTQYYQVNSDVLKAFQQRKDRGLSLSSKLWNQSQDYRNSLEIVISLALERGTSAVTLSKQISKYLKDFPSFQKDYKEKYGRAANIYDCEYRSARLARSEINIAYRTAEQTRWGQMDFIIGYEVKLSNNHNCKGVPKGEFVDICDYLAGKYPKDFKFVGWHPQCRCYTIPILKTDEEYLYDLPGKNEVKDVPDGFKQWMNDNSERYDRAKERGTLPYFVRDNRKYLIDSRNKKETVLSPVGLNKIECKSYADYERDVRKGKSGVVLSESFINNNEELSKLLSLPKGDIMNFTQADRGKCNPEYIIPKARELGYWDNCQTCTIVYELRRRGFDVEAVGNPLNGTKRDFNLFCEDKNISWLHRYLNEDGSPASYTWSIGVKDDFNDKWKFIESQTQEKGRYEVYSAWKSGNAHVWIVERQSDGNLLWFDPQSGYRSNVFVDYIEQARPNFMGVIRIDDKLINTKFAERLKKRK